MKHNSHFFLFSAILLATTMLTGCDTVGFLLTYKESKTTEVFRSGGSKKDYYIINATTLSHCGCTYLSVDKYRQGRKAFYIYYNYNNQAGKIIYARNEKGGKRDSIRLIATTGTDFTLPFDSVDIEIFKQIDSIAIHKPRGIVYEIKRQEYKGYKIEPAYYYQAVK